jgi:hypothetical protein
MIATTPHEVQREVPGETAADLGRHRRGDGPWRRAHHAAHIGRAVSSNVGAMPLGRRKSEDKRAGENRAGDKRRAPRGRDPFAHLADEREAAESEAWFLQPDDGPELEVETGISSNLSEDDLGR